MGNYLFGQASTMEAARLLADAVFLRDPYWVKHYRQQIAWVPRTGLGVIHEEPLFFPLEEQRELFAQQIRKLRQWEFLLRPAESEGSISTEVFPITIRTVDQDPQTGEYHFPDPTLMDTLYSALAAKSGTPVTAILKDQETRLTQGTTQKSQQTQTAAEAGVRQPSTLPDGRLPEQRKAKTNPSLPTLDEDQWELLTFLIEHPDSPVSVVYKGVGVGAARIAKIRDELKAQGLLVDLEVRTGRIGAGRPTKFLIPTFHAFELLGKDPPSGRGGVIHRAIQHAVSEGALAKGYNTKVEYTLQSGAIVDVHLEKGGEKIAVEIAIMSHPSREVAHIKECLLTGYDKVFGIFTDQDLLARTKEAIAESFSVDVGGKVRLLPLSLLSQLG